MHRLKLLLFLGVVLAVSGTPLVKAQEATSGLDQYKTVPPDPKQDQAKAKVKDQNNDGHRKHWWSLPHLRHKKHDSDARQPEAKMNASSKPAAPAPANKPVVAAPAHTMAAHTNPSHKMVAAKPASKTVHATHRKTVARKRTRAKTVAATHPHKKVVAHASHAKKPVRRGCTAEEAKKGGCQAYKATSQKGTAKS
jgi:hypothetical protein